MQEIISKFTMWILITASVIANTCYTGFVLATMWDWFLVPHGYPTPPRALILGVLFMLLFVVRTPFSTSTLDKVDISPITKGWTQVMGGAIFNTIALASAAVWHFWLFNWFGYNG